MQKTLYILRHAKAASLPGQDDHKRPLAARGLEEAQRMGNYFAAQHLAFDAVLCSDALRTRQTWDIIQGGYKSTAPVEYSSALYLPSADQIALLLAGMPERVQRLLVIGHNPGLHELAMKLARDGNEKTINEMMTKFPPCTFAAITFEGSWHDIARARGTLQSFVTPDDI